MRWITSWRNRSAASEHGDAEHADTEAPCPATRAGGRLQLEIRFVHARFAAGDVGLYVVARSGDCRSIVSVRILMRIGGIRFRVRDDRCCPVVERRFARAASMSSCLSASRAGIAGGASGRRVGFLYSRMQFGPVCGLLR